MGSEPLGPLHGKRAVLLDLDGVVYAGEEALPGSAAAVSKLRECGLQVRFLSNNSLKRPDTIAVKLNRLGIECSAGDVFTSGWLACRSLRSQLPLGSKVLVVGTDELRSMAQEQGLIVVEGGAAEAVLVGMTRNFGYEDILKAARSIQGGARFFACNRDGMYLGEGETYFPGCGAMVGAISGAVNMVPERSFGKPDPQMLVEALREGGWKVEECLMVGDTWTSDVSMAKAAGVDWIYVGRENVDCPKVFRFASLQTAVEASLAQ